MIRMVVAHCKRRGAAKFFCERCLGTVHRTGPSSTAPALCDECRRAKRHIRELNKGRKQMPMCAVDWMKHNSGEIG